MRPIARPATTPAAWPAAKDLLAALEKEHLDAVIAPSMSPAWLTDHVLGDHFVGAGYGVAAVAGTPSLTIPAGESHGLPLGITLMGRAWSEAELLGYGFALEQKLKARRAPTFAAERGGLNHSRCGRRPTPDQFTRRVSTITSASSANTSTEPVSSA